MQHILTSIRLIGATMLVCCVGYPAAIWCVANVARPWTAQGSLLTDAGGGIVGSSLIAQAFTQPQYFWPRLSAVGFNASATGGSNKSPANPELVTRLQPVLEAYGAGPERPLPADLATASGSGLDPHITIEAALYQAPRVAKARGIDEQSLVRWLHAHSETPGGILGGGEIVHVLNANLALNNGEVR